MWPNFVIIGPGCTGFSAVVVGDVYADDVDWSMFGHYRIFLYLDLSVRPVFADYLDFRGQNAFARRQRARASPGF